MNALLSGLYTTYIYQQNILEVNSHGLFFFVVQNT